MNIAPHILLVDDDRQIRRSLGQFLTTSGFRVTQAAGGGAMWSALEVGRFNLIVLDIMMPGEDGLALCRRLRETRHIPIVLVTAMSGETDRIVGLELGADDYICKPFNPRELLARIRAILRRSTEQTLRSSIPQPTTFHFEGWCLDTVRRILRNPDGALVDLTGAEFDLLVVLVEHPQHVLSRDQLLDLSRGRSGSAFDRSIDVQISRLRRKIERDSQQPKLIKTVRSGGYVFSAAVTTAPRERVA